ncbi:MAG TPA: hypothetical protein VFG59_19340 [Anaeromyxobacter sp.]|nr:hypothetical protein [Anaeromyxobacter sp.]
MNGLTALAALFVLAIAAALVATRRRRHLGPRPMVLATPGGRAFANHVGSLSSFGSDLELPRRR